MDLEESIENFKDCFRKLVKEKDETCHYEKYRFELVKNVFPQAFLTEEEKENNIFVLVFSEKTEKIDDVKVNIIQDDGDDNSPLRMAKFKAENSNDCKKILDFKYEPISHGEARRLISLFAMADIKENCYFCVAVDPQSDSQHRSLLALKCNELQEKRSVRVSVTGPLPVSEVTNCHLISKFWNSFKGKKFSCWASFDILDGECAESMLTVEASWVGLVPVLSCPKNAKVIVEVKPVINKPASRLYKLYKEIEILKDLVNGLKTKLIKWNTNSVSDLTITERLEDLLKRYSKDKVPIRIERESRNNKADADNLFVIDDRQDLDICDELWLILKDCTCMNDLKQSFSRIFDALERERIQPHVWKRNSSRLAQMIRDSYENNFSYAETQHNFDLIRMLIEIGLEKLNRDYIVILIGKHLTADIYLEPFVKKSGSYENRIERLFKLHATLQIVILFEQWLEASPDVLSTVTNKLLKQYEKEKFDPTRAFRLGMSLSGLQLNCKPVVWKASCEDSLTHSVLYVSLREPSKATEEIQAKAAYDLIERLLPERANEFEVIIDKSIGELDKDSFQYETVNGKLQIKGTSGVAATWGFHFFLKQNCSCHMSWGGDQLNVPNPLPAITKAVKVTSADRFRYYQNVCTVSYSFVWYDWKRWEREIDWMSLNGINFPLAFNGQEEIWNRVYLKMGLTQDEIDKHFGGPAFLAWSRMGNMKGWGGPLSRQWHATQVSLQHRILNRMRSLGMIPILPAFAGHVPDSFTRIYPHANVSKLSDWGGFDSKYCCVSLLEPKDPLFIKVGQMFLNEYIREFGTDHVYNTDTFNEMTPRSGDSAYLRSAGKAVFNAMTIADPQAIWVMQGWLFISGWWTNTRAEALLTSIPQGKMIVLDLQSEITPQFSRLKSYYGQPYIWCMLHDFGGTVSMYGAIENINKGPHNARAMPGSTMIGTGLTPEGIFQNDVIYEFMNENSWRTSPRNITKWITNYAIRRYGKENRNIDKAWQILKRSVYNCSDNQKHHNKVVVVHRPNKHIKEKRSIYNATGGKGLDVFFIRRPSLDIVETLWYKPEDVYQAWDLFVQESSNYENNNLFRYDLVDVTRQSLQLIALDSYTKLIKAFNSKDKEKTRTYGNCLVSLLMNMDQLLASDSHFLLGKWLASAKRAATNDFDRKLFEYNARNQITLWGPKGEILDYASKQWAGLIKDYYLPRWQLFVYQLMQSLEQSKAFDQNLFNSQVFKEVEEPFTKSTSVYPETVTGNAYAIVKNLHSLYRPTTNPVPVVDKLNPRKYVGFKEMLQKASDFSNDVYISHKNL
ncbi:DgyrCDS11599 [Dimorphilus gyrociliatus]|uniref:Protein zwilch n=1 Tax=Dimorphilus gyrociliatus TaxID=2664684 RepID=A0A7I8W3V2_9ANNE|nr:DgyrCDS11599 [Dimorphilus gyrociliatus]